MEGKPPMSTYLYRGDPGLYSEHNSRLVSAGTISAGCREGFYCDPVRNPIPPAFCALLQAPSVSPSGIGSKMHLVSISMLTHFDVVGCVVQFTMR